MTDLVNPIMNERGKAVQGARGVWGERVPGRLPEVRAWPLAQPDGEHTHADVPASMHVQSFALTFSVP